MSRKTDQLIAQAPYGNIVAESRRKRRFQDVYRAIMFAHDLARHSELHDTAAALLIAARGIKKEMSRDDAP